MLNEESKTEKLAEKAKHVSIPQWATHVAVRTDGSKAEPCAWMEKANEYVDEDPRQLSDGMWTGDITPDTGYSLIVQS